MARILKSSPAGDSLPGEGQNGWRIWVQSLHLTMEFIIRIVAAALFFLLVSMGGFFLVAKGRPLLLRIQPAPGRQVGMGQCPARGRRRCSCKLMENARRSRHGNAAVR